MRKKFFAVILIATLMTPMLSGISASAAPISEDTRIYFNSSSSGDKITGSLDYMFSGIDEDTVSPYSNYYYSDSYFTARSTVYNSHLATMSLVASLSYHRPQSLFPGLGFSDIATNYATDDPPTPDTIGVVMSQKDIIDDGEAYTLVSIVIRGGGYYSEWANNFLIGSGEETNGNHKGFYQARSRALAFIKNYLEENVEGKTKLWITGFSRGGAIAGIIGAWFDDNLSAMSDIGISLAYEDVFTYTFEAPATTDKKNLVGKNYSNIFNSISENDIIPRLPFTGNEENGWNFDRPGVYKPYADINKQNAVMLEEILRTFNPSSIYDINNFTSALAGLGNTQSRFLDKFVENATKRMTRKEYAEKAEGPVIEIMANLNSKSGDEYNRILGKFISGVTIDLGLNAVVSIEWVNKFVNWLSNGDEASRSLVSILGNNLERSGMIDEFDREVEVFLEALVDFLFKGENDIQMFYFIFNIIFNTVTKEVDGETVTQNRILSAHEIWLSVATQMFFDSYYPNNPTGFSEPDKSAECNVVKLSVTVDGKTHTSVYYNGDTAEVSAKLTVCRNIDGWYLGTEKISSADGCELVLNEDTEIELRLAESHGVITDWITERDATDKVHGLKYKMCSDCGKRVDTVKIPALSSDAAGKAASSTVYTAVIAAVCSVSAIALLSAALTVILRKRKSK